MEFLPSNNSKLTSLLTTNLNDVNKTIFLGITFNHITNIYLTRI